MPFSKPLHTPESHHRDRRAGIGSARLRDTLGQPAEPWRSDGERLGRPRPAAARRRAYAGVSARYGSRALSRGWRRAMLVALAVGAAMVLWTAADGGELAALSDEPAAYETLSAQAYRACAGGWCTSTTSRPGPLGDAMSRVGAHHVTHDPFYGETTIRGSRRARFMLVRAWRPTRAQRLEREARARDLGMFEQRDGVPKPRRPSAEGWRRVYRDL